MAEVTVEQRADSSVSRSVEWTEWPWVGLWAGWKDRMKVESLAVKWAERWAAGMDSEKVVRLVDSLVEWWAGQMAGNSVDSWDWK
jgi:hypothetical protein